MTNFLSTYAVSSGLIALAAGVLHVAIIFGGPDWYARFGAPAPLVAMAKAGHLYPVVICLVTAAFLFFCSAYAFSGAGMIPYLPFLKAVLIICGCLFLLRGLVFVPLMIVRPDIMADFSNSKGVDGFLIISSAICVLTGGGFLFSGIHAPS